MKCFFNAFLLCVLILCNTNSFGQQKLAFTALDDADTSLVPIQTAFNNKLDSVKVVGLGEATHGDKTTFAFNFNMVKYLVAQRGYRILLLEGPNSTYMPLDNFIKSDSAYTLAEIDTLVNKSFPPGASRDRQTAALIKWLKDYNLAHATQKVRLKGMSLDISPTAYLLNTYIKPYDAASAAKLVAKWKRPGYNRLDAWDDIFKWQDEHAQLINGLTGTIRQNLSNDFNNDRLSIEFYMSIDYTPLKHEKDGRYTVNVNGEWETVSADNFYVKMRNNPDYLKNGPQGRIAQMWAMRDSLMATYVIQGTGALKSIVWAHDYHVLKYVVKGGKSEYGYHLSMGDYLNRAYGGEYFVTITNYAKGGNIRGFGKQMTIKKAHNPMDGQTVVKLLKEKFGFDMGIAFSTDLIGLSKYNAVMYTADITGNFSLNAIPWSSFDAIAILGALYPTDLIQ
jgi:erythromycin esterase-like protein